MEFESSQSIFSQIAESLSEKILKQQYQVGEKIPSVRELAAEVGVNPVTIMRTFNELQSKGIIENKRGIGYFVTEKAIDLIRNEKKAVFFEKVLPDFIHQSELLGISKEELKSHLNL